MGHLATTPPRVAPRLAPWRRMRRRPWHRMNRLASPHAMFAAIPSLPRAELARLTERLIDRMDVLDGDPDLEPETDVDDAHDDGCGPVHKHGATFWGAAEDDPGRDYIPLYGDDQSVGPLRDRFGGYRYRQETTHE